MLCSIHCPLRSLGPLAPPARHKLRALSKCPAVQPAPMEKKRRMAHAIRCSHEPSALHRQQVPSR